MSLLITLSVPSVQMSHSCLSDQKGLGVLAAGRTSGVSHQLIATFGAGGAPAALRSKVLCAISLTTSLFSARSLFLSLALSRIHTHFSFNLVLPEVGLSTLLVVNVAGWSSKVVKGCSPEPTAWIRSLLFCFVLHLKTYLFLWCWGLSSGACIC